MSIFCFPPLDNSSWKPLAVAWFVLIVEKASKEGISKDEAEGLKKAIEESVEKSAENEGVGVIDFDINNHKDYTKEDYFEIIKPYVERLYEICGDEIIDIIEAQLGEGRRVTDATDDELVALDTIYNNLVTKATMLGIEI